MYFKNRAEAGQKLSKMLVKFKKQHCAVIALSPGAVMVGTQIASMLHANLSLLLTENINIPGEPDPIAAVDSENTFTYNNLFSLGEIEEFRLDYYSFIEQERFRKLHELHLITGKKGEINRETLKRHIIIIVSDGLNTGFTLDIASNFLKTVSTSKMIGVTPFATPDAYDRMRYLFDESYCINLIDNFLGVDHYYDDNDLPGLDKLFDISRNISLWWH